MHPNFAYLILTALSLPLSTIATAIPPTSPALFPRGYPEWYLDGTAGLNEECNNHALHPRRVHCNPCYKCEHHFLAPDRCEESTLLEEMMQQKYGPDACSEGWVVPVMDVAEE